MTSTSPARWARSAAHSTDLLNPHTQRSPPARRRGRQQPRRIGQALGDNEQAGRQKRRENDAMRTRRGIPCRGRPWGRGSRHRCRIAATTPHNAGQPVRALVHACRSVRTRRTAAALGRTRRTASLNILARHGTTAERGRHHAPDEREPHAEPRLCPSRKHGSITFFAETA